MGKLRMKNQVSISAITGIAILVIVVLAIGGCKQQAPAPAPLHIYTGPPVIVVGGSIEGQSNNGWSQNCPGMKQLEWCTPNGGSSDFIASYLYNPAINAPSITQGTSWKIHITDKNPHNLQAGVDLCGNSTCTPGTRSDPTYVYLQASGNNQANSGWDTSKLPNTISYVDKTCSTGGCEHPVSATLSIQGSMDTTYACVAPNLKGCFVGAGAPSFSER